MPGNVTILTHVFSDQGTLRVELVDGHGIHAADRGGEAHIWSRACHMLMIPPGKSDPFAVFTLNGSRVFKSQTKKKTLNPEWNETFAVGVVRVFHQGCVFICSHCSLQPSRVGSDFNIEIYDWNQIEQAKKLGSAKIELAELEPFQGIDRVVQLSHDKHGDKGEVRVRLMFQPEIIAKARKNTSTFSAAGRAMTQLGGAPLGGAKGAGRVVGGIFRKDHAKAESSEGGYEATPPLPAGQASHPVGASAGVGTNGLADPSAGSIISQGNSNEPGTLRVVILDAKDLAASDGDPVKAYVTVRVGDKEFKTKHHNKSHTPEW